MTMLLLLFQALAFGQQINGPWGSCTAQSGVIWGANSVIEFATDSAAHCCTKCTEMPICVAWTYVNSGTGAGTCYIKDNVSQNSTDSTRISGYRNQPWTVPRACSTPETSVYPFCDTTLSINSRVDDLIKRIPQQTKPQFLTARGNPRGNNAVLPDIGVPGFDWGLNCIHGVQSNCLQGKCATSFPNPIGLAASFNMSNVYNMAQVIGYEARAFWLQGGTEAGNSALWMGLDCWSPNINIARDPRWGRILETAGEDPYLSGQWGVAYTRGMQEGSDPRYLLAVTTLKHYDAYSLENYTDPITGISYTRHNFNANVSDYLFGDTYLPAFQASVTQGRAAGVMCAYNSVNGEPACANSFLTNTLRNSWGFNGYITSDTDAVEDIYDQHHYTTSYQAASCVALVDGTTDINSGNTYWNYLDSGVSQGLCKDGDVDAALRRSLSIRFRLGLFDPIANQPYWQIPFSYVSNAANQALNSYTSLQTLTLLKNDNNILPFKKGAKVAVVGPHYNAQQVLLGNYYGQICADNTYNCVQPLLDAITKANTGGTVTGSQGTTVTGTSTSGFNAALQVAQAADYVVLAIGLSTAVEAEGLDRVTIDLPGVQNDFSQQIIALGKPTVVVLINGGAVALDDLKTSAPAILEVYYPGFWGASAIASALFGDYNPGGKLPYTIYPSNIVNQANFGDMDITNPPGRTYKYYTGTPLWPFGWGLSYTTFKLTYYNYTSAVVLERGSTTHYEVNVTNTGNVAGDEVVFAYFQPINTSLALPVIQQLFGFERVHVLPGQTVTVYFDVDLSTLAMVHPTDACRMTFAGHYKLIFTNGVHERLTADVHIKPDHFQSKVF